MVWVVVVVVARLVGLSSCQQVRIGGRRGIGSVHGRQRGQCGREAVQLLTAHLLAPSCPPVAEPYLQVGNKARRLDRSTPFNYVRALFQREYRARASRWSCQPIKLELSEWMSRTD